MINENCGYYHLTHQYPVCKEECDDCPFTLENICKEYAEMTGEITENAELRE